MRLAELINRLDAPPRTVRYVLERGLAAEWVHKADGSGNHRDFTLGEAFSLGVLVKLREAGLRPAATVSAVRLIREVVTGFAQRLVWDYEFKPFSGALSTQNEWRVEAGDMKAVRVGTTASPSRAGNFEYSNWFSISDRMRELKGFSPLVTISLDLRLLSNRLQMIHPEM